MDELDPEPGGNAGQWLKSIRLERFKAAFRPPPIPLQPFTVIVGRNGSGKSTLLEALQWLDASIRYDCGAACERYHGIHDLINVRSQVETRFFEIDVEWADPSGDDLEWHYGVRVEESRTPRTSLPVVAREYLYHGRPHTAGKRYWIASARGQRKIFVDAAVNANGAYLRFDEPYNLALSRALRSRRPRKRNQPLAVFADFWNRAVFLRLSPNRLADVSFLERKWMSPLLDEEGRHLPALLNDLDATQRENLIEEVKGVLAGIVGVRVEERSNEQAYYSLSERMPYRGRKGIGTFAIPSWMLSEGTRRITAIFALLEHRPRPSLLCIEEIENGLDPWTVLYVLKRLQAAAARGTQVLVTTHSPWLLDHVQLSSILHVHREDGETVYEQFEDEEDVKRFSASVPPGTRYVNVEGQR